MAIKAYKRLGATLVTPGSSANTELYAVPTGSEAVISELTVCNKGSSDHVYYIAVQATGGAVTSPDYKAYNVPINAYSSIMLNPGFAMQATGRIMVGADSTDVVFSCSGVEIS